MRRKTNNFVRILVSVAMTLACLWPALARAQDEDRVSVLRPTLVLGNYNSVPVGPFGGLEGNAYGARVSDPSATWFNPAGLTRQNTSQISGSAGVYQDISVSPHNLPNGGGSLQELPNFVGFTAKIGHGFTGGVVLLTTSSWSQKTDSQIITPTPDGGQRFAFSADSKFTRRVGAIALGYYGGGAWRFGGGVAATDMSLRVVQGVSHRIADAGGLNTLLANLRVTGSATLGRGQGGVQYDTTHFRFGAAVRTPGFTMFKGGGVLADGTVDNGAQSAGSSLYDTSAEFEYHLPWELQGGAAYVHSRFEVEVDVQSYSSIKAYTILNTPEQVITYTDTGSGAPAVSTRPFLGLTSASDAVTNVSIGGHIRPFKDRNFRVHGGFGTSHSPVGAADQVFTHADLHSWTVGASGTWSKFQFALGFNQNSGTSDELSWRSLLTGDPVHTTVDFKATGFIYAINFQF